MLSTYDMECLSRLEDRWLDPDYDGTEDEEESDMDWLEADREYEDRICERLMKGE